MIRLPSPRRRSLAGAMLIGTAVGLIAAVALPSGRSQATDTAFRAPSEPPRTAAGRQRERGPTSASSLYLRAHPGTVRIESRAPDPAGGPEWVVRVFEADRMIPKPSRRPGSDGVASVALCAQLGRIVGGRFGWVDGHNVFRPVRTSAYLWPLSICVSRKLGERHEPTLLRATLLDLKERGAPVVRGTVLWGLTGRPVTSATLVTRGHRTTPTLGGPHGAWLRFEGPSVATNDATITVRYQDGVERMASGPWRATPVGDRDDGPVPSTAVVTARTYDPAGGPSWGLVASRSGDGRWCLGAYGSLIDGHVGDVDRGLGVLIEQPAGTGPTTCRAPRRDPKHPAPPVQFGSGGASFSDPVAGPSPFDAKLRLLHGRTVFFGRAVPEVDRITLATPRDVRTIVPQGPAHAFLVVYDGSFSSGTTVLTAHFSDGHTWHDTFENPGI